MLEILFFSLSISLDAFGYSLGFGSRKIKVSKLDFFIINLINSTILFFYLLAFSHLTFFFQNSITAKISPILLIFLASYYILTSFKQKIIIPKNNKLNANLRSEYFNYLDILVLFAVFVFENMFSAFIFYTTFASNMWFFILSNFFFHYFFFLLGFNIGNKIAKKLCENSNFISGFIFLILGYLELFF